MQRESLIRHSISTIRSIKAPERRPLDRGTGDRVDVKEQQEQCADVQEAREGCNERLELPPQRLHGPRRSCAPFVASVTVFMNYL